MVVCMCFICLFVLLCVGIYLDGCSVVCDVNFFSLAVACCVVMYYCGCV